MANENGGSYVVVSSVDSVGEGLCLFKITRILIGFIRSKIIKGV